MEILVILFLPILLFLSILKDIFNFMTDRICKLDYVGSLIYAGVGLLMLFGLYKFILAVLNIGN